MWEYSRLENLDDESLPDEVYAGKSHEFYLEFQIRLGRNCNVEYLEIRKSVVKMIHHRSCLRRDPKSWYDS